MEDGVPDRLSDSSPEEPYDEIEEMIGEVKKKKQFDCFEVKSDTETQIQ